MWARASMPGNGFRVPEIVQHRTSCANLAAASPANPAANRAGHAKNHPWPVRGPLCGPPTVGGARLARAPRARSNAYIISRKGRHIEHLVVGRPERDDLDGV